MRFRYSAGVTVCTWKIRTFSATREWDVTAICTAAIKNIFKISVNSRLGQNYTNGTLNVALNLNGSGTVELNLTDPAGKSVATAQVNGNGQKSVVMDVNNPEKWTAETPNLYTLTATLKNGSNTLEVIPVKVGFRKIDL